MESQKDLWIYTQAETKILASREASYHQSMVNFYGIDIRHQEYFA